MHMDVCVCVCYRVYKALLPHQIDADGVMRVCLWSFGHFDAKQLAKPHSSVCSPTNTNVGLKCVIYTNFFCRISIKMNTHLKQHFQAQMHRFQRFSSSMATFTQFHFITI